VSSEQGENRRWSRSNLEIFKVEDTRDRYFGLYWEEGLTENQENEAYSQVAVEFERTEKTVVVVSYEVKKHNKEAKNE
jgi:hypothetical protein